MKNISKCLPRAYIFIQLFCKTQVIYMKNSHLTGETPVKKRYCCWAIKRYTDSVVI